MYNRNFCPSENGFTYFRSGGLLDHVSKEVSPIIFDLSISIFIQHRKQAEIYFFWETTCPELATSFPKTLHNILINMYNNYIISISDRGPHIKI